MINDKFKDFVDTISNPVDDSITYVVNGMGAKDRYQLIECLSRNAPLKQGVLIIVTDDKKRSILSSQFDVFPNVQILSVQGLINYPQVLISFNYIVLYDAESFVIDSDIKTENYYKLLNALGGFKKGIIWCSCADVELLYLLQKTMTYREIRSLDFETNEEWIKDNIIMFSNDIDDIKAFIYQKIKNSENVVFVSADWFLLEIMEKEFSNQALMVMPLDYTKGPTVSCKEESLIRALCHTKKFPDGINILLIHYSWLNDFMIDVNNISTIVTDRLDGTQIIDIIKCRYFNSTKSLNLLIYLRDDVHAIMTRRHYDKMIRCYKEYIQYEGKLPSHQGAFLCDPGKIICLRVGMRGGVYLGVDQCRLRHFRHLLKSGLISSEDKEYRRYICQSLNCNAVDLTWINKKESNC